MRGDDLVRHGKTDPQAWDVALSASVVAVEHALQLVGRKPDAAVGH